ncbi:TIGR02680 family protein [Brevibacillus marinus]|uniref:TIGR02680 family protein n=1 Tax=Brevibacillus marinus TaxID=2496837 RepID=UPI000F841490|nr:TIGR02680 family protein [Brevibacillus marinus]
MNQHRWQLSRAGLVNFWYYDEETFEFADGRLLLRGTNGSGKSVTMQSFLPVVLDGKKSPDRLDPFGSKARRMEDYLLGEKEVTGRDERTGYLFLEFVKPLTLQYATVGIGLKAKRNSSIDFWGFAIEDNRRVGIDLFLYKQEFNAETRQYEKIPLSKSELEKELGSGGRVVHTQGEYAELVNKMIFGFPSLDAYEDLIKLLIQLRSPKLSKDFKPTVIYGILENALPALSDEELRPLSDAIESMDRTQLQLDQLMRDHKALVQIVKEYSEYNRYIWFDKAKGLNEAAREYRAQERKLAENQATLEAKRTEYANLLSKRQQLEQEQLVLSEEKEQLEQGDIAKAEKERASKQSELAEKKRELAKKQQSVSAKQQKLFQLRKTIDDLQLKQRQGERDMLDCLQGLEQEALENEFPTHALARREWERAEGQFDFSLWQHEARAYRDLLQQALDQTGKVSSANALRQEAEQSLADVQRLYDEEDKRREDWEKTAEEERRKLVARIHEWQAEVKQLVLPAEVVRQVTQQVFDFSWDDRWESLLDPVKRTYEEIRRQQLDQLYELQRQEKAKQMELRQTEEAWREWNEKRDPEPPRNEQTEAARAWLREQGIPHVPLYSAVEFRESLSEEMRAQIEAALAESGLLDALIIPLHLQERVHAWGEQVRDRVIIAEPKLLANTIEDWFTVTPIEGSGVSREDIAAVLQTILSEPSATETGGSYIASDGRYGMGSLVGRAPRQAKSYYVGREARERHRQEQLRLLEETIASLQQEIAALGQKKQETAANLLVLQQELERFPHGDDLLTALQTVQQCLSQLQMLRNEIRARNEKVKAATQKYLAEKERLQQLAQNLTIPLEEEPLRLALRSMNDYLDDLNRLQQIYLHNLSLREQIRDRQAQETEELAELDELKGEENKYQSEVAKLQSGIESLDRLLASKGAEEIRNRLRYVYERLNFLPEAIRQAGEQAVETRKDMERLQDELIKLHDLLQVYRAIYEAWRKVVEQEHALGLWRYVLPEIEQELAGEDKHDLEELARLTVRRWQTQMGAQDREELNNRLQKVFEQERQASLLEYQPVLDYVLEFAVEPDRLEQAAAVDLAYKWEQLQQRAKRRTIQLEYNGKRMNPYLVQEKMERDILIQREVLTEEDQKIFKDVILHSVGRVIKQRILRAEKWVSGMNELMRQRNTSSGLTFSLQWVPLTAEDEQQLDTAELVQYLQKDPNLMRDQDIERITAHFRSRIEKAKDEEKASGGGETLHQIMRRVLDYRQWFRFKLRYRREGEPWKELTDRVFFTFSGGEKAMAMYIPLFSAAYSRYLEADPQAPMIISLDEAFAGVDENNIRDMFQLIEQLGFNYMMNSQALWGDYDTVSHLAICELVRPKNADYVTVIRYRWDGKVLQMVTSPGEQTGSQHGGSADDRGKDDPHA